MGGVCGANFRLTLPWAYRFTPDASDCEFDYEVDPPKEVSQHLV